MGCFQMEFEGRTVRWYDDYGIVMIDGEIVGELDADRLDLWRSDDDAEAARSERVVLGRMRAFAIAYNRRHSPANAERPL